MQINAISVLENHQLRYEISQTVIVLIRKTHDTISGLESSLSKQLDEKTEEALAGSAQRVKTLLDLIEKKPEVPELRDIGRVFWEGHQRLTSLLSAREISRGEDLPFRFATMRKSLKDLEEQVVKMA